MSDDALPPDLEISDGIPSGLSVTLENRPYYFLLVSDLAGSEHGRVGGAFVDELVDVTPDKFDALMSAAAPGVRFTLADPVASGKAMSEVDLTFDSMRSFDARAVADRLDATKSLLAVREQLTLRLKGKLDADGLAGAIAGLVADDPTLAWVVEGIRWTASASGGGGAVVADAGAVDDLLGGLDLGDEDDGVSGDGDVGEVADPPKSKMGSLVSAAAGGVGSQIPAEEASAVRRTMGEIDRRVSAWLDAVLHSEAVQSIERAWRSLSFLVSRMAFRKGMRLAVLHTSTDSMSERINALLIDPVFDDGYPAPNLIAVDHAFSNAQPDMELMDELAQHGASLPAVVMVGVSTAFLGVQHSWQIPTLPAFVNMFDQWQFAKWKTLRNQGYARSMGVSLGRFMLRSPYERDATGDSGFSYREERVSERHFLWGNGSIAAAANMARSVADMGWPTAFSGMGFGRVEDIPTALGGKKGDKTFGPSDIQLREDRITELGIAGLNALVTVPKVDDAVYWTGISCGRPTRQEPSALMELSLPYQLFAGRLGALMFDLKPRLHGLSGEKVVASVRAHVCDWLQFGGDVGEDVLSVQTRPADDQPGALELAVTVTPPNEILPGSIPVVVGYRIA